VWADLVALIDIARFYEIEHAAGCGHSTMAVLRSGDSVELARDYSIAGLAKVLDPVRASR
jgi:hypothetical protein